MRVLNLTISKLKLSKTPFELSRCDADAHPRTDARIVAILLLLNIFVSALISVVKEDFSVRKVFQIKL